MQIVRPSSKHPKELLVSSASAVLPFAWEASEAAMHAPTIMARTMIAADGRMAPNLAVFRILGSSRYHPARFDISIE